MRQPAGPHGPCRRSGGLTAAWAASISAKNMERFY